MDKIVKPIIYITRDIERAVGKEPSFEYRIIANRTPYAETIRDQYPDYVTLIDSEKDLTLDTAELLGDPAARSSISNVQNSDHNSPSRVSILVFKSNSSIESAVKTNGWRLLNPPADLAEKVENKITQVEWLGELADKYLPPRSIVAAKNIKWNKEPLVLQWAHGHTGDGTMLVNSNDELLAIQAKFPNRLTRATVFIKGPSFTVNVVVSMDKILVGNVSYQITGLTPFTDNVFTTVGNDWGLTHSLLSESEIAYIEKMATEIGAKMRNDGWKGLFGMDIIRDDERGMIFLIEINARQPASTTFESILQRSFRELGIRGLTVFEAHLKALYDQTIDEPLISINDGAQIVQRITKNIREISDDTLGSLELAGYASIEYPNTEVNTDLLRVRSTMGIMETHGQFNKRGKEIEEIISN